MRFVAAAVVVLAASALTLPTGAAPPKLTGSWEAARATDDERVYVVLKETGKAEIVAEYDFTLPGQPGRRRGRSSSFGTWVAKGDEVIVTYSKIQDRLRYQDRESLRILGLEGAAPALKPIGKPSPNSKIGSLILWKAPHEYRVKAPLSANIPHTSSTLPPRAEPAK